MNNYFHIGKDLLIVLFFVILQSLNIKISKL